MFLVFSKACLSKWWFHGQFHVAQLTEHSPPNTLDYTERQSDKINQNRVRPEMAKFCHFDQMLIFWQTLVGLFR